MGEYEDLIQRVRDGDTDALDELEQNYSGSTLREKAEQADKWKEQAEQAVPLMRQQRVNDLKDKVSEDLRDYVSASDFEDADPDSIDLEAVQDKAKARQNAQQEVRLNAAKDAGFDTVEEYEAALNTIKEQKTQRTTQMEEVGGATAASGGDPVNSEAKSRFEKGRDAFQDAKESGRTDDVAMAEAVTAVLNDQTGGSDE